MTDPTFKTWEPAPGQCLCCGGRGGWWTGDTRTTCNRCKGDGWDPARNTDWFKTTIAPLQVSAGETQ